MIFDVSELELFVDDGTIAMAANVFPDLPYNRIHISGGVKARYLKLD